MPPEYPDVLRDLVREILRAQPATNGDIYKFGNETNYFFMLYSLFLLINLIQFALFMQHMPTLYKSKMNVMLNNNNFYILQLYFLK